MNTFKRGQAIPLIDGYTIALIQRNDLNDIIEMLGDPKVTEYLYFAPAPEDVYRDYFGPIIEGTAEAIGHGEWPEAQRPSFATKRVVSWAWWVCML